MMDSTSKNCLQRRKSPQPSWTRRSPGGGLGALLCLAVGLSLGAPDASRLAVGTAYAQDFAAAGQHFASGQDAFAQSKFELAAKEFQAAYDITHDPSMLVNIGESWQRAGDGKKALEGYRAYLAAQPQAPDRNEIEGRIKTIESALAGPAPGTTPGAGPPTSPPDQAPTGVTPDQTGAAPGSTPGGETSPTAGQPATTKPGTIELPKPIETTPAPGKDAAAKADAAAKPVVTPAESPASGLRKAGWVTVAIAVALATSGAIVGLGAQDRADELHRRTTLLLGNQPPVYDAGQAEAYTSLQSEGTAYNKASIALLSAAGVVAVTAAILFIADHVRRPKVEAKPKGSWALLPTLLPSAAGARASSLGVAGGLTASGSF